MLLLTMAVIIEIFLTPAEAMNEPADLFFLKQLLFLIIFGRFIIKVLEFFGIRLVFLL